MGAQTLATCLSRMNFSTGYQLSSLLERTDSTAAAPPMPPVTMPTMVGLGGMENVCSLIVASLAPAKPSLRATMRTLTGTSGLTVGSLL